MRTDPLEARPIPEAFTANGLRLSLVKREGDVAMYAVRLPGDAAVCGYEVHRVRVRPARVTRIAGKAVEWPRREILACNEEFGKWGWSCLTEAQAGGAFNRLCRGVSGCTPEGSDAFAHGPGAPCGAFPGVSEGPPDRSGVRCAAVGRDYRTAEQPRGNRST